MDTDADTLEDPLASQRSESLRPHAYLFLVLECDRPASGGARYSLMGVEEVVIGRGSERSSRRELAGGVRRLLVQVPGRTMSSTHARLRRNEQGWVLEDARSTNGSLVNCEQVDRAVLRDGDLLELGHTFFLFRDALLAPSRAALDVDSSEFDTRLPGLSTLLPGGEPQLAVLARVARSNISLLLLGETGTGKEVVARGVHHLSERKGPFTAVNCGALPPTLVESQLFGHVKGAFSGAIRDEPGAIRAADEGTLLLDEVGDLPREAQPAFLRFLQEREVTPIGSARPCKVDVRVIAATHQPLAQLVNEGKFRADLLARLSGFTHLLPPLRQRREDIGIIVADIIRRGPPSDEVMTIPTAVGRQLFRHSWPANIRELEQALIRGFTLAAPGALDARHFLQGITDRPPGASPTGPIVMGKPLDEADAKLRQELLALLEQHDGSVSDVARALGKARTQVHRWLKRLYIDPNNFRSR